MGNELGTAVLWAYGQGDTKRLLNDYTQFMQGLYVGLWGFKGFMVGWLCSPQCLIGFGNL